MKVSELIKELQKSDDDAEVVFFDTYMLCEEGMKEFCGIDVVKYTDVELPPEEHWVYDGVKSVIRQMPLVRVNQVELYTTKYWGE